MRFRKCSLRFSASANRKLAAAIATIAAVQLSPRAQAATQTSTWVGASSSSWSTAGNWNPSNTFPSNGNAGISDFDVTIPSTATQPLLNTTATVDLISIASSATLSIQGASNLTLTAATDTDNGLIIVNSNQSSTSTLNFVGATMSGSGGILLNNGANQAVVAGVLTLGSTNNISGFGEITASLTNNGTVNANSSGQSLTLLSSNMTNNNLMEATGTGNLVLSGITVTQGASGQISAGAATVVLNGGATISGGTLTGTTGTFQATNSSTDTLAGTVTNNATFDIVGASNLNVTGNLVDNGSVIVNNNQSSSATLSFSGGTVSGTGAITLNNGGASATLAGTLTQSSGHTINGFGQITAALTNNGMVNSTVAGNTLFIDGATATNTATMQATSGVLDLSGVSVTNTGGTIAANGNTVLLSGATITGGTLTSPSGTFQATNSSTVTLSGVTNNSTFDLFGASSLNISGNLTNNGTIVVDSNQSSSSTMTFSGGTLSGTGAIALNNGGAGATVAGTLTQSSGHTIDGFGQITANLTNNGMVNATVNGNTLFVDGAAMTNSATMQATVGVLEFSGVSVTNTGGNIVANGNTVLLSGATITGGTLSSPSGSMLVSNSSTVTLSGVTNSSTFNVQGASNLVISGNLTDNGIITVNSNQSSISTMSFGGGTLSGTGTIALNNGSTGATLAGTLTQSSGHTIDGFGQISATLTNDGLVNASVGGNALIVDGTSMSNASTMEATTGTLEFTGGVSVNNAGGTITANGGSVLVSTATITGGNLSTSTSGVITLQTASLSAPTITTNSTVDIQGGFNMTLLGSTLTNNGTIVLNSNDSSSSTLQVNSNVLLTGSGTLTMNAVTTNAVIATGTGDTLTQDVHHTIHGLGQITASLINNGTVDADRGGNVLSLLTSNMTNNSLMEATAGGTLEVNGITLTQGASGQLLATGTGSVVVLDGGATVSGGTLNTASNGVVEAAFSSTDTLANVTNNGTLDIFGASGLNITGNLVDNGSVFVNVNNSSNSTMTFSGGTLSGTGTITLNAVSFSATLAGTVTQASGHTINGLGQITANLTNNGLVNASVNGNTLFVDGTSVMNSATMEATGGGTLAFTSGVSVNNAGGLIKANGGNVNLTGASISGGTLSSPSGVIQGINSSLDTLTNVTNTATLNIQGASNLNISGNLIDNGAITINNNGSSNSTMTFSGGTLSGTGAITLAATSFSATLAGTVTQASGHTINGLGQITANLTNNGLVNATVAGNTLFVDGTSMSNAATMEATTGVLAFSSGVAVNNAGGVISANGNSVVLTGATITGGTLNSPSGSITAINSSSNTLAGVTNNAAFGIQGASNVNTTGTTTNNGTITINTNVSSSSTLSAGGPIVGTGTVVINSGGTLAFASSVGGSTFAALTITGTGRLDLNNNHLFINYGANPDPVSSIAALLASGYAAGAWNGNGIFSTAAHANAGYGLGYADSADSGNPAALPTDTIEIAYTLLGDANLDHVVNGVDFGILAANFNKGITGWDQGDFNYDNAVNGVDFGFLAANFNKGASGAADWASVVSFAQANGLMADVPEPACSTIFLGLTTGILYRRRRRPRD